MAKSVRIDSSVMDWYVYNFGGKEIYNLASNDKLKPKKAFINRKSKCKKSNRLMYDYILVGDLRLYTKIPPSKVKQIYPNKKVLYYKNDKVVKVV